MKYVYACLIFKKSKNFFSLHNLVKLKQNLFRICFVFCTLYLCFVFVLTRKFNFRIFIFPRVLVKKFNKENSSKPSESVKKRPNYGPKNPKSQISNSKCRCNQQNSERFLGKTKVFHHSIVLI